MFAVWTKKTKAASHLYANSDQVDKKKERSLFTLVILTDKLVCMCLGWSEQVVASLLVSS